MRASMMLRKKKLSPNRCRHKERIVSTNANSFITIGDIIITYRFFGLGDLFSVIITGNVTA